MKRNGKNIILSSDVTVESGSNRGKNLDEILEKQDSEIRELKSNVKWVYKYGGVGSGKGGGPGISTAWSIYARLGGELINGETIILSGKGSYKLSLKINNPAGGVFNATYEYLHSGTTTSRTVKLNQDNAWTLEETIFLDSNSKIRVEVLDENNETKWVESNYIVQSYSFDHKLVLKNGGNSGMTYTSSTIFVNYIRTNGIQISVDYSVIDSVNSFDIKYIPFGATEDQAIVLPTIDTTEVKRGTLILDAFQFNCDEISSDFIGKFSYKIELTILGKTTVFEKSLTILPSNLYLLFDPIEGAIYNDTTEELDNIYKYYVGTVSFNLTAYRGSNSSGGSMEYSISTKKPGSDNWDEQKSGRAEERTTIRTSLKFSSVGWNTIKLFARYDSETFEKILYIYIKDFESNLRWYPEDLLGSEFDGNKNIFRIGTSDEDNFGFYVTNEAGVHLGKLTDYISMSINSGKKYLRPKHSLEELAAGVEDCLICVGIQYNSTSNDDTPILEIKDRSNAANTTNIVIYQNKVEYGSQKVGDIYLGTELDDYNINKGENYHLISVYRRFVKEEEELNRKHYELCIYIDGILETALSRYTTYSPVYTDITLYPNNYFINTLELSYFPHSSDTINSHYLTDAGIVRYWYTYKERIMGLGSEVDMQTKNLLDLFEGKDGNRGVYINEGSHIVVRTKDILTSIVKYSKAPVMMLTYDETNSQQSESFFNWSEKHYGDNDSTGGEKIVGVQWSPGSKDGEDAELMDVQYTSTEFSIGIQGSTTKSYSSKNYMLTLNWTGEVTSNTVPLFSPNFDPNDSSTFLPEQAFTLKADVVDSGHSNNTCMGSFINKVTQKFEAATSGNTNPHRYSEFVKNCLEGFPFLLFLEITHPGGNTNISAEYYYLGIYNFNLGRNSYFNLGYSDVSNLPDKDDMTNSPNGFCFCSMDKGAYVLKTDFTSAEISYNNSYYDFSSYSNSILFKINDNDSSFMFDDIYYGLSLGAAQEKIQNFVKETTRAGGYIFKSIGKTFGSHEDGYNVKNQVPNYKNQHKKTLSDGINYELDPTLCEDFTSNDVKETDLLYYATVDAENGRDSFVDYQSLIEYYTICMAFGMVDSVQKNLTIKTWNGKKFYFAFYDMDTCLGIDNNGNNSTYYAFSDLWEGEEIPSGIVNSFEINDQVTVSRDYFMPEFHENIKGFDIPSSYAFAVAKYFQTVTNYSYEGLGSPQSLWAKWRNKNSTISGYGVLANADKFIEDFYLSYMKNVNELMFNYDYRQKYLRHDNTKDSMGTYGYDTQDIVRFHGRRTEYIRDWLTGRFHIMDAYLNLPQAKTSLQPNTPYFPFFDQLPSSTDIDTNNEDIFVIRDIFTNGTSSTYGNISFEVQAPDFSPLIIKQGTSNVWRYLLPNSNYKYRINVKNVGTNKIIFGGSALWTYLDSINSFITDPMVVNSSRLKVLNGSTGTVTEWTLTMPALQTLSLNSSNYSGKLIFDASLTDYFPNLDEIDISNSNIDLTVKNENVRIIKLDGVGNNSNVAPAVNITECEKLEDVSIHGVRLSSLVISPVWTTDINLSGNTIYNIDLSCKADSPSTLTISDDSLETLRVSNFSKIVINNCPHLESIYINGDNLTQLIITNSTSAIKLKNLYIQNISKLTTLSLNGCINFENLTLDGDPSKLKSLNLNSTKVARITYSSSISSEPTFSTSPMLDLTPMSSLESLSIQYNSAVEYIKLRNNPAKSIVVVPNNCSKLKRIFGHIKIKSSGVFSNLPVFRILGAAWKTVYPSMTNKTPLQIIANVYTVDPTEFTNTESPDYPTNKHISCCQAFDAVLARDKLTDTGTSEYCWFDYNKDTKGNLDPINSIGKTNITFGDTDDGIEKENRKIEGEYLSSICAGTPIPRFEIYYLLSAFAISAARCPNPDDDNIVHTQSLNVSFWYSGGDRFNYTNCPNRYMFYGCSKIISFGDYTISTSNSVKTRLLSPSHDSNGEVLCDNGLFSPLTRLGYVGQFISAGTIYISRFLFRRKTGSYPITSFRNFVTDVVHENVDTETTQTNINNVSDENLQLLGNFTGFFNDIFKQESHCSIYQSFSPNYINFNTLKIPNRLPISSVICSFNPERGYGVLDLGEIFSNKSLLVSIVNSFKIANAGVDYERAWNSATGANIDSGGKVLFPLKDEMFSEFTKLQYLGANDTGDPNTTVLGITIINTGRDESIKGTSTTVTGFSGNGLLKYIGQPTFPYNIFQVLGTNLITCSGFMSGLSTYNGSYGDEFNFPGTLFNSNTNLKNVAAFLKNCKIPYRLTSGGFSKCTKLENITEIFYGDTGDNNISSKLVGKIPPKLFYHGIKSQNIGNGKVVYGISELPEGIEEINDLSPENYYGNEDYKVIIPLKPTYNTNIRYAYAAFRGCALIEPYSFEIGADFGRINPEININGKENIENIDKEYLNSSYTYWKYVTDGQTWIDGNTKPLDISSVFDGDRDHINPEIKDIAVCEEDFNEVEVIGDYTEGPLTESKYKNVINFFCCPDLFSYFENSSTTNIQYMFCACGLSYARRMNTFTIAMTGRICPYLLKPISNISSLAGMFRWCSGLSSVKLYKNGNTQDQTKYLIPPDFFYYAPSVSTLAGTFSGLYFENNPYLNVFQYLFKPLDVRGIFAWCGYVGSPIIQGVFTSNKFTRISGAFSARPISIGDIGGETGGVSLSTTSELNRTGPKFVNNFPTSEQSRYNLHYYVYYKHGTNASDVNIVEENQNIYHNYN